MEPGSLEIVADRRYSRRHMLGRSSAALAASGITAFGMTTPAGTQSPTAGHAEGDFAGLVDIGGRSLYLTCASSGSPTVVLVTGVREPDTWSSLEACCVS